MLQVLAYDDFVWLDGKLVATLRNGFTPASPFSSGGLHFDETSNGDCGRVGATGACGLTHIVNDILPKPILAIHSNSGLISGVGMYDEFGAVNQVPVISGTNHPYNTMGPDGGVVGVGRLPGFAQADARVLYNYVDLPTGVSATVNNDAGVTGTHRGHVWSDWAPRDNYRATVRVGAPSGTTQGVQVDLVEFRSYATGAIPYFPTLRFPGQYADAETEKYINWNRFYDPSTGRYLQPEPLLHDSEFARAMAWKGYSAPVYSYALNNPIRYVDRDGRVAGVDDLVEGAIVVALGEALFYTGVIAGGAYCIGTHCLGTWDDLTGAAKGDAQVCEMGKGGKQHGENEWTLAVKGIPRYMNKKPCDILEMLQEAERRAGNWRNVKALNEARKFMGCTHSTYSK